MWSRHKLLTKQERLLRLEKTTCERQIELNPEQIRLLERFSPEFREPWAEPSSTRAPPRCSRTSTPTWSRTIPRGPIRAAA